MPAIAVTAFLGFLGGWTEFYFVSTFLRDPKDYTLALALNKMVGAFGQTPWSDFAAFAILFALPVSVVFFFFQRYIVGGLADRRREGLNGRCIGVAELAIVESGADAPLEGRAVAPTRRVGGAMPFPFLPGRSHRRGDGPRLRRSPGSWPG